MKTLTTRSWIGIGALILFLVGVGVILATARPEVAQGEDGMQVAESNRFTLEDVSVHAEEGDCWTAVNGSVYDLTSWVSRHPGGAGRILELCGIDGSEKYDSFHGSSDSAARALTMLKIGELN